MREKPTSDEIRQMRAQVEAEQPAAPSASQAASSIYRPWGVKETAVDALGRIGEVAVVPLIQALADPDPGARTQAARALARIGPAAKEAVPELMRCLDDPDEEVRQAAARALGQIGPAAAPAVPALVGLIESSDNKAPRALTIPAAVQPSQAHP
jgi:HEAT repeat protein